MKDLLNIKYWLFDLDNTLWGGVIGEEGIGGIARGEEFPGKVYKSFHFFNIILFSNDFHLLSFNNKLKFC